MAFITNDRVKETTATTGTGTVTLAGAVTHFESFNSGIGNGSVTYYCIVHEDTAYDEWEVGVGTYTHSGTTLTRSAISSSNSDSEVSFTAGTKSVFITMPASKGVLKDNSGAFVTGDGSATGFMTDVVDDTSPTLGGDLDVGAYDITSASDADIDIIPNGTGDVNLGADTVQVGDNDADATITTQGTGDLILNTNNGTNAGNITLLDGADANISITPNGTGDVVLAADSVSVGDSGAAATLTSNGAGTLTVTTGGTTDLILSTNSGTSSGTITITDAANEAITLTPNGTGVVAIEGSMNPSVSSTGKSLIMGF